MDIYQSRFNWKVALVTLGIIIVLVTVFYANYLANQLAENEYVKTSFYLEALDQIQKSSNSADIGFYMDYLDSFDLPSIVVSDDGRLSGNNWGEGRDTNTVFLQNKVDNYKRLEALKYEGFTGYSEDIYIFNSPTLTYVRYFPTVQIVLVSFFVLFAYFLFNASRRAEQNRVWAGMAKETAHQLGTPISAILGWIEHLKLLSEGNNEQKEVLNELINDVDRLELVADRFSKIGSAPILKKIDLYSEILTCKNYMQRRSPKRIKYIVPEKPESTIWVMINQHLFDWVIENLIRNALDAMDGKGQITITLSTDEGFVIIDLKDSGKGISSNKFKAVFKPGYSTKQRGWGLGLSLAKRIIEDYHKGKIFVKNSKPNEGTTFTIKLPLAEN